MCKKVPGDPPLHHEWKTVKEELRRQGIAVAPFWSHANSVFSWRVRKEDEDYYFTERELIRLHKDGKLTLPIIRKLGKPSKNAVMSNGVSRVFLDTEVFIHGNFNYKSPRFKSLMHMASFGMIQVFLTELTRREIETNIRKFVKDAVAAMKPAKPNKVKVLKNSDLPHVKALFNKLDAATIQKELIGQFKKFLEAAKVTVLEVPPAVLPPVLDAYFEKQPPFGPGKNKCEFPDALVLETLREWCAQNKLDLAVVSPDEGIKATCDGDDVLHPFDNITKYLNAFFDTEEAKALPSLVRDMIPAAHGLIIEKAKEAFPYLGAILVDEDGEVGEIALTDVEFGEEPEDLEIISLAPDKAEVELAVSMTFLAELQFMKPGTGVWDSEDKVLMFQKEVKGKAPQELEGTIGVEVAFEHLNPQLFEVRRVWFEGNQDIEVNADYERNWDKWRDVDFDDDDYDG